MADKCRIQLKVMINRKRYGVPLTERKKRDRIEKRHTYTKHSVTYFDARGIIGLGTGTHMSAKLNKQKSVTFSYLHCQFEMQTLHSIYFRN